MIVRSPLLSAGRYNGYGSICSQCLRTLSKSKAETARSRPFSTKNIGTAAHAVRIPTASRLRPSYFLSNGFLDPTRAGATKGALISTTADSALKDQASSTTSHGAPTSNIAQDLPHRRRQKAKKNALAATASSPEAPLPLDASSKLSTHAATLPPSSLRRYASTLLSLTKPRLSFLIILTTTSAYSIYPVPALLSPSLTDVPSLSTLTLLFLTTGTALTCASANTLNMLYEPKWDALMTRTRNRPLVRGLISPRSAVVFAVVTAVTGVAALYYGVNPTVAFLGGLNIFLYAGVYTPFKRISAINTWFGAIVGGIPPLMGWAAAAGQSATGSGNWQDLLLGEQNIGGWLLAALLFAWQFPHFMALSWGIREEYKAAGYKMMCWTNPSRNARVALRYSLLMVPICVSLSYWGVTDWAFAVTSAPLNAWLCYEAWRFWKYTGAKGSARGLFWASVWYLPVVMVLAMVEKKGMMSRVWRAVVGEPELDDEWEEEEEDEQDARTSTPTLSTRREALPVPALPDRSVVR